MLPIPRLGVQRDWYVCSCPVLSVSLTRSSWLWAQGRRAGCGWCRACRRVVHLRKFGRGATPSRNRAGRAERGRAGASLVCSGLRTCWDLADRWAVRPHIRASVCLQGLPSVARRLTASALCRSERLATTSRPSQVVLQHVCRLVWRTTRSARRRSQEKTSSRLPLSFSTAGMCCPHAELYHPAHVCMARFILVDAHVLTTPVITDLNGDGGSELIVAVSYFFDQDVYQDEYFADDGTTIDPSAYVWKCKFVSCLVWLLTPPFDQVRRDRRRLL